MNQHSLQRKNPKGSACETERADEVPSGTSIDDLGPTEKSLAIIGLLRRLDKQQRVMDRHRMARRGAGCVEPDMAAEAEHAEQLITLLSAELDAMISSLTRRVGRLQNVVARLDRQSGPGQVITLSESVAAEGDAAESGCNREIGSGDGENGQSTQQPSVPQFAAPKPAVQPGATWAATEGAEAADALPTALPAALPAAATAADDEDDDDDDDEDEVDEVPEHLFSLLEHYQSSNRGKAREVGLATAEHAATTAGFAFVLISHGGTGAGAFGAEGGARVPLPAAGALEYRNTQAGTTFDSRARSAPGVAPTDAAYFDDAVLALSIADVANAARLSARDWGDVTSALLAASTLASQTFTRADIAAVPGAIADFNTGQNTLNFGALTARAVGAGAVNVSSGIGTSGQGIGAIGALSNLGTAAPLDSAAGEGLDFRFATNTGRYLGISLVDFGDRGGLLGIERVRFRFLQGGTPVASIDKPACRAGDVRANYLLDSGAPFDEVVVTPITTTTGSNSTLLVGGLRSCTALLGANSCTAAGAIPADDCP